MNTILAVTKNATLHEQQAVEWAKHGINAQRVDSMHEAIVKLKNGERFFFIVINEDCIPDLLIQLPLMREITTFPIIVITSTYTVKKKLTAIRNGADIYVQFSEKIKHDILMTFEVFSAQNRWANRPTEPPPVLLGGDIIMSLTRRTVLVKDREVVLNKKQFDLLRYLMENGGRIIPHDEIYRNVWGGEYECAARDTLRVAVNRLRQELSSASDGVEYIETVRDIGYRFPSVMDT